MIIYKTRHWLNIVTNDNYHFHDQIGLELLQKIFMDKETLIEEAFNQKKDLSITYDFNYPIGVTLCVECPPHSKNVYYKMRGTRKYLSRMVRGILPPETSKVTVVLSPLPKAMLLKTAWFGDSSQPELGNISAFDRNENPMKAVQRSAEFWLYHALIDENPSGEELYKDVKTIAYNEGLLELTCGDFNRILNARLNRTDIEMSEEVFGNKDLIPEWLETIKPSEQNEFSKKKFFI